MRQVRLIFHKDVRHLRWVLLAVLLLTAAHARVAVLSRPIGLPQFERVNAVRDALTILLPLAIAFLVAQLTFEEALTSDRPYWLTRPYHWEHLLGAKILFLVLFVSVPLCLSDCYILGTQGFAIWTVLPKLLLRQAIPFILFVIPSFAIATVTSGLTQFLTVCMGLTFVVAVPSVVVRQSLSAQEANLKPFALALLALLSAIVLWQYATRGASVGRALFAIVAGLFLTVLWGWMKVPEVRADGNWPEHVSGFDIELQRAQNPADKRNATWEPMPDKLSRIAIPLTVAGLPPGTILSGTVHGRIHSGSHGLAVWKDVTGSVRGYGGNYWVDLFVPEKKNRFLRTEEQVFNDKAEATIPLDKNSFLAPELGRCEVFASSFERYITCRAGLDSTLETKVDAGKMTDSVPRLGIPWGLSPLTTTFFAGFTSDDHVSEITIIPRRKLAEFERTLDVENLRLNELRGRQ